VAIGAKRRDALEHFLDNIAARQDDAVADASPDKLVSFGITKKALDATTPKQRLDLALEAVAAVDLMR
jgi:hypothetical protein